MYSILYINFFFQILLSNDGCLCNKAKVTNIISFTVNELKDFIHGKQFIPSPIKITVEKNTLDVNNKASVSGDKNSVKNIEVMTVDKTDDKGKRCLKTQLSLTVGKIENSVNNNLHKTNSKIKIPSVNSGEFIEKASTSHFKIMARNGNNETDKVIIKSNCLIPADRTRIIINGENSNINDSRSKLTDSKVLQTQCKVSTSSCSVDSNENEKFRREVINTNSKKPFKLQRRQCDKQSSPVDVKPINAKFKWRKNRVSKYNSSNVTNTEIIDTNKNNSVCDKTEKKNSPNKDVLHLQEVIKLREENENLKRLIAYSLCKDKDKNIINSKENLSIDKDSLDESHLVLTNDGKSIKYNVQPNEMKNRNFNVEKNIILSNDKSHSSLPANSEEISEIFDMDDRIIQEKIESRRDEWLSRFVQIIEEVLSQVLQVICNTISILLYFNII